MLSIRSSPHRLLPCPGSQRPILSPSIPAVDGLGYLVWIMTNSDKSFHLLQPCPSCFLREGAQPQSDLLRPRPASAAAFLGPPGAPLGTRENSCPRELLVGGYTKHGAQCLEGWKESIGLTGVIVAQGIMAPKMPRLHLRTCSYATSGAERDFGEVINRGSQDGERRLFQITGVAQGEV